MIKESWREIIIKLEEYKLVLLTLFFAGVFADVFFLHFPSDWRFLGLLPLWVYVTRLYHFKSDVTFKIALVYLGGLLVVFIFSPDTYRCDRIATWIYLFLVMGLVQQFRELTS